MIFWLLVCVPCHLICRILGLSDPWPRRFLSGIAKFSGVRITVTGERVKGGEFLLVNHVSWIDIPAIAAVSSASFVAHDGLAASPMLRWLCAQNGTVFVARHDRTSVHRQVEQVRAAIDETGALAIFPEGTTSDGTSLLPFKSALLSALFPLPENLAVQPVLLDYGAKAEDIAWVGEEPGLDNFMRILARSQPIRLAVHFLPPLTVDALTDRKTIAAAARDAILSALQASSAGR